LNESAHFFNITKFLSQFGNVTNTINARREDKGSEFVVQNRKEARKDVALIEK
jgi:hypothetical protein